MERYIKDNGAFAGFSDEELNTIAREFQFSDTKASEVLKNHDIPISVSAFTKKFPLALREEIKCEYCGTSMYARVASRARALMLRCVDDQSGEKERPQASPEYYCEETGIYHDMAVCPNCGHFVNLISSVTNGYFPTCKCQGCLAKLEKAERERVEREQEAARLRKIKEEEKRRQREELEARRREILLKKYKVPEKKRKDTEVKPYDMLKILTLCFFTEPRTLKYIHPDSDRQEIFTKWVNDLLDDRLISVSPLSDVHAFTWEGDNIKTVYLNKAMYNINVDIDRDFARDFLREEVPFIERYPVKGYDVKRFLNLYQTFAAKDGMRNFERLMDDRGIPCDIYDSDRKGFRDLYAEESYTKINRVIYTTVRYFSDLYIRGKVSRNNVGPSTFANIRKFYYRSLENDWIIKDSDYHYAGKEVCYFIQNVLGKDLSILMEVPSEKWFMDIGSVEEAEDEEEVKGTEDTEETEETEEE